MNCLHGHVPEAGLRDERGLAVEAFGHALNGGEPDEGVALPESSWKREKDEKRLNATICEWSEWKDTYQVIDCLASNFWHPVEYETPLVRPPSDVELIVLYCPVQAGADLRVPPIRKQQG